MLAREAYMKRSRIWSVIFLVFYSLNVATGEVDPATSRQNQLLDKCEKAGDVSIITGKLSPTNSEQARAAIDMLKKKTQSAVIVLGFAEGDKATLLAAVTDDLAKNISASDILKQISPLIEGGGGGPSDVWIVKCDIHGNILKEKVLEGRHPSVTINDDIFAVVLNKADFPQQDISIIGLDENLKPVWKIDSLFGKTSGLGMLRTIVNKRGDFVLAGSKKLGSAALWKISKDGKILGETEIKDANLCPEFENLLQTPKGYLVAGHSGTMSKILPAAGDKDYKVAKRDTMDIFVAEVTDLPK
jgi:hypothetical protein